MCERRAGGKEKLETTSRNERGRQQRKIDERETKERRKRDEKKGDKIEERCKQIKEFSYFVDVRSDDDVEAAMLAIRQVHITLLSLAKRTFC